MEFARAHWSIRLRVHLALSGRNNLIQEIYHYFAGIAGHNDRSRDIISELLRAKLSGGFDETTCKNFRVWYSTIDDLRGDPFRCEEFETLMGSYDFMLLCYCLCLGCFRMSPIWNKISVRCSDGVVKMDKRVATNESEVLTYYVDDTVGSRQTFVSRGEIPLGDFSSNVISELDHFVMKKHDFSQAFKNLMGHYKGWFTEYLKRNRDILSDLHRAADFLSIKGLFSLTGEAVRDLMGRTLEEISRWCENLTISQLSSSLAAGVGPDWFQKPKKTTHDAPKKKKCV